MDPDEALEAHAPLSAVGAARRDGLRRTLMAAVVRRRRRRRAARGALALALLAGGVVWWRTGGTELAAPGEGVPVAAAPPIQVLVVADDPGVLDRLACAVRPAEVRYLDDRALLDLLLQDGRQVATVRRGGRLDVVPRVDVEWAVE